MNGANERPHWLDRPGNVTRLVWALYGVCALLWLGDLLYDKHAHFGFEQWVGFYAVFGFVAYCGIVSTGKLLRRLVRRPENYYGEDRPERSDD